MLKASPDPTHAENAAGENVIGFFHVPPKKHSRRAKSSWAIRFKGLGCLFLTLDF
jgi:hypothetical protein